MAKEDIVLVAAEAGFWKLDLAHLEEVSQAIIYGDVNNMNMATLDLAGLIFTTILGIIFVIFHKDLGEKAIKFQANVFHAKHPPYFIKISQFMYLLVGLVFVGINVTMIMRKSLGDKMYISILGMVMVLVGLLGIIFFKYLAKWLGSTNYNYFQVIYPIIYWQVVTMIAALGLVITGLMILTKV